MTVTTPNAGITTSVRKTIVVMGQEFLSYNRTILVRTADGTPEFNKLAITTGKTPVGRHSTTDAISSVSAYRRSPSC